MVLRDQKEPITAISTVAGTTNHGTTGHAVRGLVHEQAKSVVHSFERLDPGWGFRKKEPGGSLHDQIGLPVRPGAKPFRFTIL